MNKEDYRNIIIDKRNKLNCDTVVELSKKIFKRLQNIDKFYLSSNVLIYASFKNEVDTFNIINYLLDKKVKVALPKVIDTGIMNFYYIKSINELEHGCMNILEPVEDNSKLAIISENTVIITPGVAFDHQRGRIGYGGGFYDRYLGKNNIFSIALAYDFQILEKLPIEKHDKNVNMIVTESKIIE